MKKTKKILSVFLVVAGLVASLTGCDKNTIIKKENSIYKKMHSKQKIILNKNK